MSKFKKSNRDYEAANDGNIADIYDASGEHFGAFKVRFCDVHANTMRLILLDRDRRMTAPERHRMQKPITAADFEFVQAKNVELFITHWLVGWDVIGADGKPVPYTAENAKEYFTECPWIFSQLERFSLDESNFLTIPKEEIVKN